MMNALIIADTSAFISLVSITDRNHTIALEESEKFMKAKGSVIIPSDVFTETMNVMGKQINHKSAMETAKILLNEPAYVLIDTDEQIRQHALLIFQNQNERVSFTDCVVMALADKFKTKEIFGFDKVFRDNGYNALIGK